MKKWFVFALFVPMLAFGQGRIQAFSVNVETNHLSHVVMGTDSLHRTNLVSRYQFSVQHLAEALDARWGQAEYDWGFSTNGWTVLLPSNGTAQATLNFIDAEMGTARVNMTNLLNAQGAINTNFTNLSNAFVSLQGTINTNAALSSSNAAIANWNQGNISNLVGQVLHNVYRSFTNIPGMSTNPAYTNVASTNFGWSYSWKPEGEDFESNDFDVAIGFVDLASAFTGYSDGQLAPVSNLLGAVTFDGAYLSHWGYSGFGTRTFYTNVYTNTASYDLLFPADAGVSSGSYATAVGALSLVPAADPNFVRGVRITAPGRYYLSCGAEFSDLSPIASGTNDVLEGSGYLKFQAFDGFSTPINFWRGVGRLPKPSAGWVPADLGGAAASAGPDGAYSVLANFSDMFLVSEVNGASVSATNPLEIRVQLTYTESADVGAVPSALMIRGLYLTIVRTATWGGDGGGGGGGGSR